MTKGNGRDELHVGKARKETHKRVTNEPLIIKRPEHANTCFAPYHHINKRVYHKRLPLHTRAASHDST